MADSKISALTAVATPVSTDEFPVNQSNVTKKMTRAQVHTLESGEHLVLPQVNEAVTPTLAFGPNGDGIYSSADGTLRLAIGGVGHSLFDTTWIVKDPSTAGPGLLNANSSATVPTIIPFSGDSNTGIGGFAGDQFSLIAGGVQAENLAEVSSAVLRAPQANVGLTADTGSAQGNGVITSSYNVYSTVEFAGDAATLPATFGINTLVHVKNDAAVNSMDVFPASGDDLGQGTDTVEALVSGDFVVYMATTANATWTKLMGGTA